MTKFPRESPAWMMPKRPYAIAHRGASDYAPGNSLAAFQLAADLGCDFFELDIRLSGDGTLVLCHDPDIPDIKGQAHAICDLSFSDISDITATTGQRLPCLADILDLAKSRDIGIYADIKSRDAALPTLDLLCKSAFEKAILGAFDRAILRDLGKANCPYPRATLIPRNTDPFEGTGDFDILHLCWEKQTDHPDQLITQDLLSRARSRDQHIVLWHEERPDIMASLRKLPVLGICSNKPEMVNPFQPDDEWPVKTVCHRGAERLLPENTTAGMACGWSAGFSHIECDIRQSADGFPFIMHDETLDRTTNGAGYANSYRLETLCALDAGSHAGPHFFHLGPPTLQQVIELAQFHHGNLYLELKTGPAETVLNAVRDANYLDHCFFWSESRDLLVALRQAEQSTNIMTRRQDYDSLQDAIHDLGAALIEFTIDEDPDDISRCAAQNIPTMIAYMGTDPAIMEKIISLRPDYVNLSDMFTFRHCYEKHFA